MKIAIIGGGFYGCYFAYKLKKYGHEITIFEKNKKILLEAAINNQYRLHKGFHYPRSIETITQTNKGADLFIKEFKKYVFFPKQNIYAIHKHSKINFKKYTDVYKKNKIDFKILKIKLIKKFFTNPDEIIGAINVKEGVIKLEDLYKNLKKKLKNVNIITNTKVNKVSPKNGRVFYKKKFKEFDLILNCTFINPNMGLEKNLFKLKYEISSMLHVKNFLSKDVALTLMDGKFGSLYPINNKILTLSSVKYTPFRKFNNLSDYEKFISSIKFKNLSKKNSEKILKDLKKYFLIPKNINIKKITNAPKVKVEKDYDARRLAIIKSNYKVKSILCGKLDAAPLVWKKLIKII